MKVRFGAFEMSKQKRDEGKKQLLKLRKELVDHIKRHSCAISCDVMADLEETLTVNVLAFYGRKPIARKSLGNDWMHWGVSLLNRERLYKDANWIPPSIHTCRICHMTTIIDIDAEHWPYCSKACRKIALEIRDRRGEISQITQLHAQLVNLAKNGDTHV